MCHITYLITEDFLQIDIDEELLTKSTYTVRPLFVDFIQRRLNNFSVEVWRGSIASSHDCLKDTDVVIGIEIIEHLFPLVLEAVPQNVFGFIRPKVAMFTTPNSEYNVHFDGLLENGFRHEDHKFEWTRAQFREWCENICHRYPEYSVKYFGIGPPPPKDSADVGYVSQLAVFVRNDLLEEISQTAAQSVNEAANDLAPTVTASTSASAPAPDPNVYFDEESGEIIVTKQEDEERVGSPRELPGPEVFRDDVEDLDLPEEDLEFSDGEEELPIGRYVDYYIPIQARVRNDSGNYEDEPIDPDSDEYKLLFEVDYPVQEPDTRERPEILLDEAVYQIRRLKMNQEEYYDSEENVYRIPLQLVVDCMGDRETSLDELRPILTSASYRITENNHVTVNGDDESEAGSEEDFEYDIRDQEDNEADDVPNQPAEAGNVFNEDEELWD